MQPFRIAHGAAEDWAHAAKQCADGLGKVTAEAGEAILGFLYVSDDLANDFSSILTYLRQKTGIEHWVGSVGMGVCTNSQEFFSRPAVVAMAASFAENSFCVFPTFDEGSDQLPLPVLRWIDETAPPFGIVHGDPSNPAVPALVDELAELTSGFLIGGMTSSRTAVHQAADGTTDGGVSGVLFAPGVEVATGLSQGCAPMSDIHVISDCLDNVIIGLDGKPALDVFKEEIGELLSRDLHKVAGYVHAALPIAGSDTGDYMVRDLTGIDPARGWLAIGGEISPGDRIMFVRRDPKSAEEDLLDQLQKLKRRLPGPPRGGVYISCIARGVNMFGYEGREMELIRDALGDFPMVGFFSGAEISNSRFYAYTGVICLFT